ncbi:MAG: cyclodeaminase/cyclohydrolase family protein [Deltaproteobacteria bacterium]|nr:cyclodeaminase/cyclohydrolase family protein [Deltaproteobacteria bacterium]MBW2308093.1 cyclodeaminase/cyclohydrolase family protein [Deltaproteobacteria bacterium]
MNPAKKESIETLLKQATRVPLKIAFFSNDVSKPAHQVCQKGTKLAFSGAKVASLSAKSSVKGAQENVKIKQNAFAPEAIKHHLF